MRRNTRRKMAPVAVALAVAAVMLPVLVILLRAMGFVGRLGRSGGVWTALAFLAVYALTAAAVFVGVLAAMRERLREIDDGEEDEAKKY